MDYSALANKYGGVLTNQNLLIGVDYASLAKKYNAVQAEEEKKSLSGFIGNIPSSAGNLATVLFDMVVHPIKTLEGFGNVLKGTVSPSYAGEEFAPGTTPEEAQTGKGILPVEQSKAVQTVDALADYFGQRYGGSNPKEIAKNVANTAYEDPVGFAFDLSVLLEGGGGILTKVGKASEVSKVVKAGEAVTKIGEVINPIRQGVNVAKAGVKLVPGAVDLGKKLATFGTSQATGLSPSSIKEIIANPENFSPSAMKSLTREGLAEEAISKINGRLKQLEETGKEYKVIRELPNPIKVQPNLFAELIESTTGLTVDYGGKLIPDTLSKIRIPGEVAKLQSIFDRYNPLFKQGEMLSAEFLNLRTDLADMAKFESSFGRNKALDNLSGIIRGKLNTAVRPSIKGLEELDRIFGAESAELKAIKRDYFNANGTLKDNAVSKIANLTGRGKEAVLGRMEKIIPGITERVITLKAIEDIQLASGQKVGAYTRAILVGGGVLTINPVAIVAAILASPHIAVQILRGYGKLLGLKDAVIQKIIAEYQKAVENIKANPEGGFVKNPLIRKEAPKPIPPELEPLAKEARKYKSAEEFVKANLPRGYKQFTEAEKQAQNLLSKYGDSKIDVYGSFSTGVRRGSGKALPDLDLIIEDPKIAQDFLNNNKEIIASREAYAIKHNAISDTNRFKTPFEAVGRLDIPEKYQDLSNKFSDVKIKINDHWFSIHSDGTARALGDSLIKEQLVNRKPLKQALEDFRNVSTKSQLTDFYNQAVKRINKTIKNQYDKN